MRSGTTLLSKMLSAHQEITIPSDPYMQFFKSYRNEYFLKEGANNFLSECPLGEELTTYNQVINEKMFNSNFDLKIDKVPLETTKENICNQALRDSPKIISHVKKIKASNYSDLLDQLMKIIYKSYGNLDTTRYGFKSTFSEQFISSILNKYKNAKCICIIRDPRAIYASHVNEHQKQYPILFTIKQWRKAISFYLKLSELNNQVYTIKYEDLIRNKEDELKKISNFLKIKYETNMSDESLFINGDGGKWLKNSSYTKVDDNKDIFDTWKSKLSKKDIELIEYLTQYELEHYKYSSTYNFNNFSSKSFSSHENINSIYDWVLPFYKKYSLNDKNMHLETQRIKNIEIMRRNSELKRCILENFLYAD